MFKLAVHNNVTYHCEMKGDYCKYFYKFEFNLLQDSIEVKHCRITLLVNQGDSGSGDKVLVQTLQLV